MRGIRLSPDSCNLRSSTFYFWQIIDHNLFVVLFKCQMEQRIWICLSKKGFNLWKITCMHSLNFIVKMVLIVCWMTLMFVSGKMLYMDLRPTNDIRWIHFLSICYTVSKVNICVWYGDCCHDGRCRYGETINNLGKY